jgi:two-component system LytT family response regulator
LSLRALIIDDEKLARDKIRYFLQSDSEIEIVGECASGVEALTCIRKQAPDLLFLDIQMPVVDGFDLLKRLRSGHSPAVIFVTAYDEYAVKAFDASAMDYLLKPFTRKRFEQALHRVKRRILEQRNYAPLETAIEALKKLRKQYLERIAIKSDESMMFLRCDQIDWIQSEDNYVSVHSAKEVYLVRESLKALERSLDPSTFLRIHRRIVVNIDRIRQMQEHPPKVILVDGSSLPVSRRLKQKVKRLLFKKQN